MKKQWKVPLILLPLYLVGLLLVALVANAAIGIADLIDEMKGN